MKNFPDFYSEDLKELIIYLLKYDPINRPSFKQIANKPIM